MNGLLVTAALLSMAAGTWLSFRYTQTRRETRINGAWGFNLLALALLLADFILSSLTLGRIALTRMGDSMVFFAIALLAVNAVTTRVTASPVVSLIITPIAAAIALVSLFSDQWFAGAAARQAVGSTFIVVHVMFFVLSYALFSIAAAFAVLFLLQDSVLKSKNYTALFFKLPALVKLDAYSGRAAMIGLSLLTLAIAIALTSFHRLGMTNPTLARGSSIVDATMIGAMLIWFYYVTFAVLRIILGWTGRRSCYVSVLGLALVLGMYFFAKLFPAGTLHGYNPPSVSAAR